MTMLEWM